MDTIDRYTVDPGNSTVPPEVGAKQGALTLIWSRRRFLIKFAGWPNLGTAIVIILWPNQYQSSVHLMPPDTGTNPLLAAAMSMSGTAGSIGSIAGDAFGIRTKGELYLSILHSRNVQDAIIKQFDLQKVYRDRYMVTTRRELDHRTDGEEDRKSGVLTITVTDRSPTRAAQIANAYVVEINRVSSESDTGAAHRERVFLDQRLAEVGKNLDEVSQQLAQFSSNNLTLDVKGQGTATVEAGAQLQGRLIAAEAELRGLQQIYSEDNARVRAQKATVDELRVQLDALGGGKENQPNDQIYPSLRKLPLLGAQYSELYRQVTIQETVYELLTRQRELAKIEEAKELPVLRVLDAADIPERHSSPKRTVVIALAAVLSLGLGMIVILFSSYWEALDPLDSKKQIAFEIGGYAKSLFASRVFHPFQRRQRI